MPIMPRPPGKAKKIAFSILGTPPNMLNLNKRGSRERYEERLLYKETINQR